MNGLSMRTIRDLIQMCLLCAVLLPAAVQAQLSFTTNNGAITITGYNGNPGAIVIPSTINGYPVSSISNSAFAFKSSLTSVTILNNLLTIGAYAFQNCWNLTNVTVPGSVTNIGDYAFYACYNLTGMYFQGNAPGLGSTALGGPVTVYYLPGTSGWSSTFGGRPAVMLNPPNPAGLLKVTLAPAVAITNGGGWQVDGGVVQPSGATVSGLSVGNHTVTFVSINGWAMPASQSIAVSANSTATTSGTYGQLTYTTNNGAITITGYTALGGAVELPSIINGQPVTRIGTNAFQNCNGLGNVTIPSSVTNIGDYAFYACYGLTGIYFQGNAPGVGSGAFIGDPVTVYYQPGTSGWSSTFGGRPAVMLNPPSPAGSLKVAIAPAEAITAGARWQVDGGVAQPSGAMVTGLSVGNHTVSFSAVNGWITPLSQSVAVNANSTNTATGNYYQLTYTTNNGALTITGYNGPGGNVVLPGTANGLPVTSIGNDAFLNRNLITSVTIGTNITRIGEFAFYGCTKLTNVTIGTNVSDIQNCAFRNCSSLTSVTIPNRVTSIEGFVFTGCSSLAEITVDTNNPAYSSLDGVLFDKNQTTLIACPGGKALGYTIPGSVAGIGGSAFYSCTKLTSVVIGTNITSIAGSAFHFCTSLTNILLPDSVTDIGDYAFSGCPSLAAIMVDPNNPVYSSLDGVLFNKDQTRLVSFPGGKTGGYTVPDSVTTIGGTAFSYCNLTSVTTGINVTNFEDFAFYSCDRLNTVIIPDTVISFGYGVFGFCGSLASVYVKGNAPSLGGNVFFDAPATVYYFPETTGWETFDANSGLSPAVLWNPQAQTADGGLGVQNDQFGFNITGSSNLVIVVEACQDLVNPVWTPVGTNTLTDGSSYFSDSEWTNYPGRFYRLRSP
jgi:BspA type Leucine rich repeat region (6 copies)